MNPIRRSCKAAVTVTALAVFVLYLLGAQGCGSKDATMATLTLVYDTIIKPAVLADEARVTQIMAEAGYTVDPNKFFEEMTVFVKACIQVLGETKIPIAANSQAAAKNVTDAATKAQTDLTAARMYKLKVAAPPVPKAAQ